MRWRWFARGLKFLAFAVLVVIAAGYLVMTLWNFVLPPLTGWHSLGFGQALALLVLCRLLFGGWRGRGGRHHRMRERRAQLSPEERARLRERFGRCGIERADPETPTGAA